MVMPFFFVLFAALPPLTLCAVNAGVEFDLAFAADGLGMVLSTMSPPLASALRRRRGRPRKFAAPSRAVTLTLPESVLESLAAIDPDPSRAIVQLAKQRAPKNGRAPAELSVFGRRAVITVRPTTSLERRMGIDLVPLPDGRALISFDQPKTTEELELLLYDALDDPKLPREDRQLFEAIGDILKEARRSAGVTLLRRSIIVLESAHARSPSAKPPREKTKPTVSPPKP